MYNTATIIGILASTISQFYNQLITSYYLISLAKLWQGKLCDWQWTSIITEINMEEQQVKI